jgi:hypothetical protein
MQRWRERGGLGENGVGGAVTPVVSGPGAGCGGQFSGPGAGCGGCAGFGLPNRAGLRDDFSMSSAVPR